MTSSRGRAANGRAKRANHQRSRSLQPAAPSSARSSKPAVAIFTPSPLLTVTVESGAGDSSEIHLHAGGQGFWVARMVARLGVPVTLCAPFGDDTGRVLRVLVEAEGVAVRGIEVQAANGAYVHDRRGGQREVVADCPGGELRRHEIDDLYGAALVTGLTAGVMVLTGPAPPSLFPPDFYRRLATDLRTNGCRVVADLSGDALEATLIGGIDLLKISHEEMSSGGFAGSDGVDSLLEGVDRLQQAGAEHVLVTRAAEPALARVDGRSYEIVVPRLDPLDHRGSGDSLTAGLAVGMARDLELEAVLRLAAAAGALNVTRRGLGTGQRADIEQLSHYVTVRELVPDGSSSGD